MLYRGIDVDEETPVQYAGVYLTKWQREWGEPTKLFFEVPADELGDHLDDSELLALARKCPEVQALVDVAYRTRQLLSDRISQDAGLGRDRRMEKLRDELKAVLAKFEAPDAT